MERFQVSAVGWVRILGVHELPQLGDYLICLYPLVDLDAPLVQFGEEDSRGQWRSPAVRLP